VSGDHGRRQKAAEHAVAWVDAHKSAAVTQSGDVNIEDLGRQISRSCRPSRRRHGRYGSQLAGLDLSRSRAPSRSRARQSQDHAYGDPDHASDGQRSGQATQPTAAPAGSRPARRTITAACRRAGAPTRPTVERPRGLGLVGIAILLLVLAAVVAAAVFLLRRS